MESELSKDTFLSHFEESFGQITDPRQSKKTHHRLMNILLIGFCTILCGGTTWRDMELFGYSRRAFLEDLLDLSSGIPTHDTFRRVFSRLSALEVESCFRQWIKASYGELVPGDTLSIDGKALRATREKHARHWTHLVHVWCEELGVCLAQLKTDKKSNEITAIPALIKSLSIKDCVVSIDAMGCQHEIAASILEKEADYLLCVKDNQAELAAQVEKLFEIQQADDQIETLEKGHGRIESRKAEVITKLKWMDLEEKWEKVAIQSVIKITSTREIKAKKTQEQRYYICSYQPSAQDALKRVRGHWGIENKLHWQLDVSFSEDQIGIKKGFADENLAIFRKMALHLLKHGPYAKGGIKRRMNKAAWDEEYLLDLILNLGYL